jgi:DNA-binding transcriptional ArsR family regulator
MPASEPTPSSDAVPGAGFQPAEFLLVTTPEQLKAINDPLRLNILEILVCEALTVKQVASRLGQPPTRLYYHVNALEEAGFVIQVETRVKSGIIEKYYRATFKNIQVDRKLLSTSTGQGDPFQTLLSTIFDSTISDLSRSLSSGLINTAGEGESRPRNLIISRTLCELRPEDVPVLIQKFEALMGELSVDRDRTDTVSYACTLAFYPRVSDAKEVKG